MFRGSAAARIDAKGRFKVPSDFRRTLAQNWGPDVFVTSIRGDFATLYPLPVWEEVEARLLTLPATDRARQRYLQRASFFGQQTRLDAQGRIVVPPVLRETAAIVGEVVVCGSLDHLQIWNRQRFTQRLEEEPFTDDDFKVLTKKGI